MKIKTFVGQQFLHITDAEKQFLKDAIVNTLVKRYPVKSVSVEETDISTTFTIQMFDGISNYRLSDGTLVKPKYIRLMFISQNGYDEAEVGKCYEWKEGFKPAYNHHSYSFKIDVLGDERRYRCKNTYHNVGIRQTVYTYGTDLSDLEVESGLQKLCNWIDNMFRYQEKKNVL